MSYNYKTIVSKNTKLQLHIKKKEKIKEEEEEEEEQQQQQQQEQRVSPKTDEQLVWIIFRKVEKIEKCVNCEWRIRFVRFRGNSWIAQSKRRKIRAWKFYISLV